ncbi:MAG: hypothetical protein AB1725_07210 [Armatimonadota bacterium]
MSVNAYQVPKEEPSAPAELVCENRYLRVNLSARDGGSVQASPREGSEAAVAGPLSAPGRAVLTALREGEQEARAFLGGVDGGTGITWEAKARVESGSAALLLSWSLFNRRMAPTPGTPLPLRLPAAAVAFADGAFCSLEGRTVVAALDRRVGVVTVRDGTVLVEARSPALLSPLRTRSVSCTLHFVSASGVPVAANRRFVVLQDREDGKLRVHSAEETPSAKVFLQLEGGETVEAPLSAYPERPAEYAMRGLGAPPKRLLIRSEEGEALMDAPVSMGDPANDPLPVHGEGRRRVADTLATLPAEWAQWEELPFAGGLRALAEGRQADAERLLLVATHSPGLEHAAWFALGLAAMRDERWLLAAADFEESLLYCGSNPLAWWLKNWSLRNVGEEDEHDLPNAHFLAPLEPCLRMEAFLSGGGEKVLEEFGADPVPFLEVADLLWWCGQEAERQMVLAAGAEQTSDALLHRLRAISLRRQGMEMEAAEEERRAAAAQTRTEPHRTSELMELHSA